MQNKQTSTDQKVSRLRLMAELSKGAMVADQVLVNYSLYLRPKSGVVVKVEPTDHGFTGKCSGLTFSVCSREQLLDTVYVPFHSVLVSKDAKKEMYIEYLPEGEDWGSARPVSLHPLVNLVRKYVGFWGKQNH